MGLKDGYDVEVTEEMRKWGKSFLMRVDPYFNTEEDMAEKVYRIMHQVSLSGNISEDEFQALLESDPDLS